ncbi:mitochondrial carrier domain-containing protein [Jimgerdemannia flammicorona]|nr:mitochondrial carrier domain-containing protein [Jimgerdemannia flammicorona]
MTTNPYRLLFRNKLDENRTVIAASSAAVCGVVAGFPFDSVKTRMQTHHYNSMFDCVHKTYIEEGFGGFFRGIIPPLITISIIKSISFSVYVDTKNYLSATTPGLDGTTLRSLMALSGIAGAASGAVIASLSCPLELVKIQKQLEQLLLTSSMATGGTVVRGQNGHVNRNALGPGATKIPVLQQQQTHGHGVKLTSSWHSAKEIARLKGITGLYKGFTLHLGEYEIDDYGRASPLCD